MVIDWEPLVKDVTSHREDIINKMIPVIQTDLMLFWGKEKELYQQQQKIWGPILEWGRKEFSLELTTTNTLDVPKQNKNQSIKMKAFLKSLSDKELAAFYVAGRDTKSVLLSIALVKKAISAEEAYNAAFLEERWQSERWGVDEEAEKRRLEIKEELLDIEKFLK